MSIDMAKQYEDKNSYSQCSTTFAFKQGLNRHWKFVHNESLSALGKNIPLSCWDFLSI